MSEVIGVAFSEGDHGEVTAFAFDGTDDEVFTFLVTAEELVHFLCVAFLNLAFLRDDFLKTVNWLLRRRGRFQGRLERRHWNFK